MVGWKRLILEQMTESTERLRPLRDSGVPVKGWIRAIREALGMSGTQFARRLSVSGSRVVTLEKAELDGGVTIRSMRKAAEALDCVFVYGVVPRSNLEEAIRLQAQIVARQRLKRSGHTMLLEGQQLSEEAMRKAFDATVEELIRTMPTDLWDAPE